MLSSPASASDSGNKKPDNTYPITAIKIGFEPGRPFTFISLMLARSTKTAEIKENNIGIIVMLRFMFVSCCFWGG
jgi:hypothetical protein